MTPLRSRFECMFSATLLPGRAGAADVGDGRRGTGGAGVSRGHSAAQVYDICDAARLCNWDAAIQYHGPPMPVNALDERFRPTAADGLSRLGDTSKWRCVH